MRRGVRGGSRRKMGYGEGASAPRRRVDSTLTQGGVEFTYSAVTGLVTCGMCRQTGDAKDLRYMLEHAAQHRPRTALLAMVKATLEQLGDDHLRVAELALRGVAANPEGFAALVAALESGERKHPGRGLGPSPDQDVFDHLGALDRHADRAWEARDSEPVVALAIDVDTGLPHAALAAARGVLAVQRARGSS